MGISLTILFLSACQPTTKNQTDVPRIDISKPEKNNDSAMFSTHTQTYGQLADGTAIDMVTLHHPNGMEMDVISYGGIITRLTTPDRQGVFADVVLGLDNLEDYVNLNPYFGALIGRWYDSPRQVKRNNPA
jgi:aldose 1-epimerase